MSCTDSAGDEPGDLRARRIFGVGGTELSTLSAKTVAGLVLTARRGRTFAEASFAAGRCLVRRGKLKASAGGAFRGFRVRFVAGCWGLDSAVVVRRGIASALYASAIGRARMVLAERIRISIVASPETSIAPNAHTHRRWIP